MTLVEPDQPELTLGASSVLRWMGSKRRLASRIVELMPRVGSNATYYEPFFGSGAVFFAYRPTAAVVGDSNEELVNAWMAIRDDPEGVWSTVAAMPNAEARYYAVRSAKRANDAFTRAVRFVYLNRYCYNGIYRTNRRAEFNVPYGRATGNLPGRRQFEECSAALAAAQLTHGDFETTLATVTRGDLVYLDPPWESRRATYGEYGYSLHADVSTRRIFDVVGALSEKGVKVLLSLPLRYAEEFARFERTELAVTYNVASSADSRSRETELLIRIDGDYRLVE